ncbi:oxidoreductase C-terminal domain-containing protein, partial [Streptosporangium sp. NPDC006013]|uniref:oxidoreductase C-terminal domain-containing protein n=1 Tax=Streptosporangium sp. NPDC006013 TaxID=3155596 RepID=UPI0033AEB99C
AGGARRSGGRPRAAPGHPARGPPAGAPATLVGDVAVYDPVPYFWSEQFGHMVQYAGYHDGARLIRRGDPEAEGNTRWAVCWVTEDDRLAAVLSVNRPRDLVQGRRLIEGGRRLDVNRLADPAIALRDCTVA